MPKIEDVLTPEILKKMILDVLLDPETSNLYRDVLLNHIKVRLYDLDPFLYEEFYRRDVQKYVNYIINEMIKKDILAKEELGKISISPEYLSRETQNFNLDESLRHIIQKIIHGA